MGLNNGNSLEEETEVDEVEIKHDLITESMSFDIKQTSITGSMTSAAATVSSHKSDTQASLDASTSKLQVADVKQKVIIAKTTPLSDMCRHVVEIKQNKATMSMSASEVPRVSDTEASLDPSISKLQVTHTNTSGDPPQCVDAEILDTECDSQSGLNKKVCAVQIGVSDLTETNREHHTTDTEDKRKALQSPEVSTPIESYQHNMEASTFAKYNQQNNVPETLASHQLDAETPRTYISDRQNTEISSFDACDHQKSDMSSPNSCNQQDAEISTSDPSNHQNTQTSAANSYNQQISELFSADSCNQPKTDTSKVPHAVAPSLGGRGCNRMMSYTSSKKKAKSAEMTVTLTGFILTFTFVLSYAPYFLVAISRYVIGAEHSDDVIQLNLVNIAMRFYFFPPALSPLIYFASNTEFRRKCQSLWS